MTMDPPGDWTLPEDWPCEPPVEPVHYEESAESCPFESDLRPALLDEVLPNGEMRVTRTTFGSQDTLALNIGTRKK
jgi:hypothetical protein